MVMRVQVVDGEYRVVVPPEAVEALQLKEGAPVEIVPLADPRRAEHRYVTFEEGMEAFKSTLPIHSEAYRELAK